MKQSTVYIFLTLALIASMANGLSLYSESVHNWLEWFEDFFIGNIWLNLTYTPFKFVSTIVCGLNSQDYVIDAIVDSVGGEYFGKIDKVAAKATMKSTADARCSKGFTNIYDAYNYTMGNKVLWDQNFDSYNYTP